RLHQARYNRFDLNYVTLDLALSDYNSFLAKKFCFFYFFRYPLVFRDPVSRLRGDSSENVEAQEAEATIHPGRINAAFPLAGSYRPFDVLLEHWQIKPIRLAIGYGE